MEEGNNENQNQMPQEQETEERKPAFERNPGNVSFPSVGQQTKSGGPKTILIAGILILVAVLGFVVYKSATKSQESTEPTPFENVTTPSEETSTSSAPSATATPKASDRKGVSISILNGTGISGEAAYLQTQLESLGYSDIKVGNASSQDASTTTVVFSKELSSDIVSELTQKLNSIYQKVTTSTSSSATTDVVITTGLRKGATVKPSATPAGTPKPSSTPSSSPTPTPTG